VSSKGSALATALQDARQQRFTGAIIMRRPSGEAYTVRIADGAPTDFDVGPDRPGTDSATRSFDRVRESVLAELEQTPQATAEGRARQAERCLTRILKLPGEVTIEPSGVGASWKPPTGIATPVATSSPPPVGTPSPPPAAATPPPPATPPPVTRPATSRPRIHIPPTLMRMKAVTAPIAITDEKLTARLTPVPPSVRQMPAVQEPETRPSSPPATPPPASGDPAATDPRLLREAILVRVHRSDFAGANQILQERLPSAERDVEIQAVAAWVQANLDGRCEAATSVLTAIVDANPNAEHPLYYRGMVQNLAGEAKAALRDFVSVVRINPRHASALMEIKKLREALGHGRE
jgi:hypothetical protein